MRNIALKLSALVCLILLTGCVVDPVGDSTITIVNNSDKTLRFYFDSSQVIEPISSPFEGTILTIQPYNKIALNNWWKKQINSSLNTRLFLFDKAVIDGVPWDTIRANNMYLKRIDLSVKTLDSLNWTLTYP
jgi:hypothetical protein